MAAIVPRTFGILLCCGATLLGAPAASRGGEPASPPAHAATAAAALRAANVRTGFCVHLGCGDGALTAELARNGSLLVHALATDAVNVAAARSRLCRLGLYGQVSVDRAHPAHLPYADGLANVVVVDETPRLAAAGLSLRELLRVLSPGGAAVLGAGGPAGERELKRLSAAAGIEPARVTEGGRAWAVVRKPRPQGTDDWTHRAYDAGGNCVSDDTAVGPLASLRWIAGPAWPMGTGYQVSNGGSVAAGGRTFHVTLNEASNAGRVPQRRNNTWFLTARDAHNGLLLWSRPIGRPMRRDGQEFARLLIAASRQVYAAVGGDLVGLDPATGRTVRTYRKNVAMSGKLALSDGTLVLSQPKSLCAMDAATGEPKWQHAAQPQDLLVGAGGVFYATPGHKRLIGLDLRSGRTRWQADLSDLAGRKKQVLFVAGGIVVFVWERNWQKGANGIAAFAAADGKRLWSAEYDSSRATWADTVWYVDGLVWRREAKTGMVGLAPATGKVVRRIALKGGYCGGCVRNIATRRYLISTRPPNFLAWDDGRVYPFRAGRHGCRAGVIVANGLLYSQPHGCKCVRESLRGFIAFAPASEAGDGKRPERLQSGPATASASEADPSADWPMFRHDPQRTGGTSAAVPAELKLLWEAKLDDQRTPAGPLADEWRSHPLGPDRLTAPVVAGGGVYAALRDAHRVVALDARSGAVRWAFTAGGRVDTPPDDPPRAVPLRLLRRVGLLPARTGRQARLALPGGARRSADRGVRADRVVLARHRRRAGRSGRRVLRRRAVRRGRRGTARVRRRARQRQAAVVPAAGGGVQRPAGDGRRRAPHGRRRVGGAAVRPEDG